MVYGKPQILIALGSPSDIGILKGINYPSSAEFYQGIASAHRTEDVVAEFAKKPWDAIIAGAGYVNALANAYKGANFLSPRTLVFGLPIWNDDAIANAASFFSSHVTPPGVPIAYGQTINFAVGAAARLTSDKFHHLGLVGEVDSPDLGTVDSHHQEQKLRIKNVYEEIQNALDALRIQYQEVSVAQSNDLPLDVLLINVGLTDQSRLDMMPKRKEKLIGLEPYKDRDGTLKDDLIYVGSTMLFGLEKRIVGPIREVSDLIGGFFEYLEDITNISHSGPALIFETGKNLALFAAQVLARDNKELESRLRTEFEKQREKYKDHKELVKLN